MDNYSIVGKRIPHRDAMEKVKGSAVFTSDIKLSGMLHGKILRSPVPHAKIRNIDISKAEKLKGVKAVFTAKDVPLIKFSISPTWADKLILANKKVRYIGDEIAAVVAVDEERPGVAGTGGVIGHGPEIGVRGEAGVAARQVTL